MTFKCAKGRKFDLWRSVFFFNAISFRLCQVLSGIILNGHAKFQNHQISRFGMNAIWIWRDRAISHNGDGNYSLYHVYVIFDASMNTSRKFVDLPDFYKLKGFYELSTTLLSGKKVKVKVTASLNFAKLGHLTDSFVCWFICLYVCLFVCLLTV